MMGQTKMVLPRAQGPMIWLLFSWHLISLFLLCILIVLSKANSSSDNEAASSPSNINSNDDGIDPLTTTNDSSSTNKSAMIPKAPSCNTDVQEFCPDNEECNTLPAKCIDCNFNLSCPYGSKQKALCIPKNNINCTGDRQFEREYVCRYCYQLPHWQTWCNQSIDCSMNKPRTYYPARPYVLSTCWARSDYLCMGRRCFYKQLPCNWSQGYKWSTALLLSIFLGGFGVDRFYLGLWKEALGKLLTFGGLGVWTLVDVILIAVGYIGPLDGSLYI